MDILDNDISHGWPLMEGIFVWLKVDMCCCQKFALIIEFQSDVDLDAHVHVPYRYALDMTSMALKTVADNIQKLS